MSAIVRPVHPGLRGLLAGPMVAYDLTCHHDHIHLGVPSLSATVIIAIDEPLDIGWWGSVDSRRSWVLIAGLHMAPAVIRTHGVQRGIQLALTPLGIRALFGLPIGVLAHDGVGSSDLGSVTLSADVHEQIAGAAGWEERLALVEAHLLSRRADAEIASDIRHASSLLTRGTSVRSTAAEAGWSQRHLTTRLVGEIGLRPKQISRLGRFTRARELVAGGTSLIDAAHASGYADQAHLSREWAGFAGQPPSREEEFVFLQDLPGVVGAPSTS